METITPHSENKQIALGNEIVSYALVDEGTRYFSGYPGTPSTEIIEKAFTLQEKFNLSVEWAVNEAVALEEAAAAAISGKFAVFTAKHVGLNVAADALLSLAYMGIEGALVVCISDDPSIHSSQNEQDTRWYARLAHLPIIEPTDPESCYQLTRQAVRLSHQFKTPVILRLTTRISHSISEFQRMPPSDVVESLYKRGDNKFMTLPAFSKKNKIKLFEKMDLIQKQASEPRWFKLIDNFSDLGVIATSSAASYLEEMLEYGENFDLLVPYLTNPTPTDLYISFLSTHKTILVVEELDDILEVDLRVIKEKNEITVKIHGKDVLSFHNEIENLSIQNALNSIRGLDLKVIPPRRIELLIPKRLPTFCIGCGHRGAYYSMSQVLKNKDSIIANDVGCYALGVLAPYEAGDTLLCMGASIGMGIGFSETNPNSEVISVIGDSTFWHSGINALASAIWRGSNFITVVLDNSTTAMTGAQENPSTKSELSIAKVAKAMGATVFEVDGMVHKEFKNAMKLAGKMEGVKVIVSTGPCVIYEAKQRLPQPDLSDVTIDKELCTDCEICYTKLYCPAIKYDGEFPFIETSTCTSCGYCIQVCPRRAINFVEE